MSSAPKFKVGDRCIYIASGGVEHEVQIEAVNAETKLYSTSRTPGPQILITSPGLPGVPEPPVLKYPGLLGVPEPPVLEYPGILGIPEREVLESHWPFKARVV